MFSYEQTQVLYDLNEINKFMFWDGTPKDNWVYKLWENKKSKEFIEVFFDIGDVKKDKRKGFDDEINEINVDIIIIIVDVVIIETNILFFILF